MILYFLLFLYRHSFLLKMEDPVLCHLADVRLKEVQIDWSHDGFFYHISHDNLPTGTYRENLAKNFSSPQDVFKAWQNSPEHNKNLLAPMTSVCFRDSNNYWVMEGYK